MEEREKTLLTEALIDKVTLGSERRSEKGSERESKGRVRV